MRCQRLYILLAPLLLCCGIAVAQKYDGLLEHSEPVDISRYIEVCDWLCRQSEDYQYYNELDSLINLDLPSDDEYSILYSGKSYAVHVPKLYLSRKPSIRHAQNLYNGFVYVWNIYCNYEVWMRINESQMHLSDLAYMVDDKDAIKATKGIRISGIRDRELRRAARNSRNSIVGYIKNGYDEMIEDKGIDILISFCNLVYDKSFKFEDTIDTNDIIDSIWGVNMSHAQERLLRYLDSDEEIRLKVMLDEMAACNDFDEQCVLWINWVMNRAGGDDYLFLLATGDALMDSGKYSPILDGIWDIWRSLFQPYFHGVSVDALIPNAFYNKYRKKCFITCLKHIDKHPDDVYAIMCAANLATNSNIERYGGFGNAAMTKILPLIP